MPKKITRKRNKPLRLPELIAIGLGGMVGGGIFSILGVSVKFIGNATPIAILAGGILAMLAAYSYVKLALLYKDEGATYSFFKKTFPKSKFAASSIGWLVVFGYISTLALYAFTFSSYFAKLFSEADVASWINDIIVAGILLIFAVINLVSVKGMGEIEDLLVYLKIVILLVISGLLAGKGEAQNFTPFIEEQTTLFTIFMIASLTFVAFEGFQLIIHAYEEMEDPERNIPRAIYGVVIIAIILYVGLATGTLASIPKETIIEGKECALAAGTKNILGHFGYFTVIFGALLATSSAISGTVFGASRLIAVIADDGYFPKTLGHRIKTHIPNRAIILMCSLAFILVLSGGLRMILEFGSTTFIIVSFLMAVANFKQRHKTNSSLFLTIAAMAGLLSAGVLIFVFEWEESKTQLLGVLGLYAILMLSAYMYSKTKKRRILNIP